MATDFKHLNKEELRLYFTLSHTSDLSDLVHNKHSKRIHPPKARVLGSSLHTVCFTK